MNDKNKMRAADTLSLPLNPAEILKATDKHDRVSRLTLGPLLYQWQAHKKRDFYYQVADELDVDVVYLGEVVCSKREPFFSPYIDSVRDRLIRAGKEVVLSTLALVTTEKESKNLQKAVDTGLMVEANDVAALPLVAGSPFVVGPTINVLNEGSYHFMARSGAVRIVMASEMPLRSIGVLADCLAADSSLPALEVQVFGRQSLAVSMRCYHARAFDRDKDHCQIACNSPADGLVIDELGAQPILTINGTQVLSSGYGVGLKEIPALKGRGVTHFRLSPQDCDMIPLAELYRRVLLERESPESATKILQEMMPTTKFMNGFFHAKEGMAWVD